MRSPPLPHKRGIPPGSSTVELLFVSNKRAQPQGAPVLTLAGQGGSGAAANSCKCTQNGAGRGGTGSDPAVPRSCGCCTTSRGCVKGRSGLTVSVVFHVPQQQNQPQGRSPKASTKPNKPQPKPLPSAGNGWRKEHRCQTSLRTHVPCADRGMRRGFQPRPGTQLGGEAAPASAHPNVPPRCHAGPPVSPPPNTAGGSEDITFLSENRELAFL